MCFSDTLEYSWMILSPLFLELMQTTLLRPGCRTNYTALFQSVQGCIEWAVLFSYTMVISAGPFLVCMALKCDFEMELES